MYIYIYIYTYLFRYSVIHIIIDSYRFSTFKRAKNWKCRIQNPEESTRCFELLLFPSKFYWKSMESHHFPTIFPWFHRFGPRGSPWRCVVPGTCLWCRLECHGAAAQLCLAAWGGLWTRGGPLRATGSGPNGECCYLQNMVVYPVIYDIYYGKWPFLMGKPTINGHFCRRIYIYGGFHKWGYPKIVCNGKSYQKGWFGVPSSIFNGVQRNNIDLNID